MTSTAITDKATGVIYRRWICSSPDAVFLLVHGLGAHSGRWEPCAAYFLQNAISSYAVDLPGFGETPGVRGHADSFAVYFEKIQALGDIARRESGGKPVFLVGESLGGLIAFLAAKQQPDAFAGLICLSPAFKSRLRFNAFEFLRICLLRLTDAKRPVEVPFTYAMCTRDAARVEQMEQDTREHRTATPQLLLNIALSGLGVRCCPGALKIPVLFLIAGKHDAFISPAAVERVHARLRARDKKLIRYPEMFHALSVELGRERIFQDMLLWVRARIRGGEK